MDVDNWSKNTDYLYVVSIFIGIICCSGASCGGMWRRSRHVLRLIIDFFQICYFTPPHSLSSLLPLLHPPAPPPHPPSGERLGFIVCLTTMQMLKQWNVPQSGADGRDRPLLFTLKEHDITTYGPSDWSVVREWWRPRVGGRSGAHGGRVRPVMLSMAGARRGK